MKIEISITCRGLSALFFSSYLFVFSSYLVRICQFWRIFWCICKAGMPFSLGRHANSGVFSGVLMACRPYKMACRPYKYKSKYVRIGMPALQDGMPALQIQMKRLLGRHATYEIRHRPGVCVVLYWSDITLWDSCCQTQTPEMACQTHEMSRFVCVTVT